MMEVTTTVDGGAEAAMVDVVVVTEVEGSEAEEVEGGGEVCRYAFLI